MNKIYILFILAGFAFQQVMAQKSAKTENQQEFQAFIKDLKSNFIYYPDKKEIITCIEQTYYSALDTISHPFYKILFYENLLNELYDSHIHLTTNTDISYRLNSPIYAEMKGERFFIKNVFTSQLDYSFTQNILGAEILAINDLAFDKAIETFPTLCHNKQNPKIKEWLANKVIAGKRKEARVLHLKLINGKQIRLDVDRLIQKSPISLLTSSTTDNVGIIRINNSLGNTDLVAAFDQALDNLMHTEALILDLRNTPSGGNTGVAEPIIGRFISKKEAYQVCENFDEKYKRYVMPRSDSYTKPLYVLVGRWTGSMGEGMTIGFDGIGRATIIGTEMYRLAGGMEDIKLLNSNYYFKISIEKMYHPNGTLRELFVPEEYVSQTSVVEDEFMKHALKLIKNR